MYFRLLTCLPLLLPVVSVYAQRTTSVALPTPVDLTTLHPQPTSSSSPMTCPDKSQTIPNDVIQNMNLALDASGNAKQWYDYTLILVLENYTTLDTNGMLSYD